MAFLNLAAYRDCTESEGPGKRFAIWCQGCNRNCPDCCNGHMQPFIEKTIVDVGDLFQKILKSHEENDIEGVSFIGGEPILQAEGFAELAVLCKKQGLSVLLFTGFLFTELKEMNNSHITTLLENIDLLVDGPFLKDLYDSERDWIGSKNQKLYNLSTRYKQGIEYEHGIRSAEILVSEKSILINGWPFQK